MTVFCEVPSWFDEDGSDEELLQATNKRGVAAIIDKIFSLNAPNV